MCVCLLAVLISSLAHFSSLLKNIGLEMQKRKKNSGELCRLMEKTFYRRQKWIKDELPSVDDILLKYSALKHAKVVNYILCFGNDYAINYCT